MNNIDKDTASLKRTARLAGLLYLGLALAGAYGLVYVPSVARITGDPIATSQNILGNELLFRSGIACMIFGNVLYILLALVLYRLFRPVNERQARVLCAFVLVEIPIAFLLEVFNMTALLILKGQILNSFEPRKAQEMAMLFLNMNNSGTRLLEIYWGLWLIPLAQLVYRSGFIPRIFGILLLLAALGYLVESLTFILFPQNIGLVHQFASKCYSVGELSTMLWLLIVGAKSKSNA